VTASLQPGTTYYLVVAKEEYDFGEPLSFQFVLKVTTTFIQADAEGITLELDQPVPGLAGGNITILDANNEPVPDLNPTLTTTDNKTYRVGIASPLQPGLVYKVAWFGTTGYDIAPVEFEAPDLDVHAVISEVTLYGFSMNLYPGVPGLGVDDFAVTNQFGKRTGIDHVSVSPDGKFYRIHLAAPLLDGASYHVLPKAEGYVFGDSGEGFRFDVPAEIKVTRTTAWVGGVALQLEQPVPLEKEHITLKALDGQDLLDFDLVSQEGGTYHEIRAKLNLNQGYALILDVPGYFEFSVSVTVKDLYSFVRIADESVNGFMLILRTKPTVGELTKDNVAILKQKNDPSSAVPVKAVTSEDGGETYYVEPETALEYGQSYWIRITKPGYTFLEQELYFPIKDVQLVNATLTAGGVSFRVDPAITDLKATEVRITGPDNDTIPVTGLIKLDDGTYEAIAELEPGTSHLVGIVRDGYRVVNTAYVYTPSPAMQITDFTLNGFTVRFEPAAPGLTADHFDAGGFDLVSVETLDNGKTYRLTSGQPFTAKETYSIFINRPRYNYGPSATFRVPVVEVENLVARVDGVTVTLNQPIPDLKQQDVRITRQDGEDQPFSLTKADNDGRIWEIKAYMNGGTHTLFIDRDDVLMAPYEFEAVQAVAAAVSDIASNGFVLTLLPGVPDLVASNVKLRYTRSNGQTGSIALKSLTKVNEDGTAYKASVNLPTDYTYELNLDKAGFGLISGVTFRYALPPELLEAYVEKSGSTVSLFFDKEVRLPNLDSFRVSVITEGEERPVTISGVAFGSDDDPNRTADTHILLLLDQPIQEGKVKLSGGPALASSPVTAADGGTMTEMEDMAILRLGDPSDFVYYLRSMLLSPEEIAEDLPEEFDLTLDQFAEIFFAHFGYEETAKALLLLEPTLAAGDMAVILAGLDLDSFAVADILKKAYGATPTQLAVWLKAAGYSLWSTVSALLMDRGVTAEQLAVALTAANAPATAEQSAGMVANVLVAFLQAPAETTAQSLKAAGVSAEAALDAIAETYAVQPEEAIEALALANYPAGEFAAVLWSLSGLDLVRKAGVMVKHGYAVPEIIDALEHHVDAITPAGVIETLRLSGGGLQRAAQAVRHYGFAPSDAYAALLGAKYTAHEALTILGAATNSYEAALVARAKDVDASLLGAVMRQSFGETVDTAVLLLRNAGYPILDVRQVLLEHYGLSDEEASVKLDKYFTADQMAGLMRLAGKDSGEALAYVLTQPGYPNNHHRIIDALKKAGYSAAEIATAIQAYQDPDFRLPASNMAHYLRDAGFAADEAVAALMAAYDADLDVAVQAVSGAYGAVNAVNALKDQTDLSTAAAWLYEGVLQNGSYGNQWPPVSVKAVLDLFSTDPAAVAAALRQAGFAIGYAGDLLKSVYGVTALPAMIEALKQSGYGNTEVLVYVVGAFNALAYVGQLKDAGYGVIDVAKVMLELNDTASQAVSGLRDFGIEETTLALRTVYGLDAAQAYQALIVHYAEDIAQHAIEEIYEMDADEAAEIALQLQRGRYNAIQMASALKSVYGVKDPLDAARKLDEMNYDRNDVLSAILDTYLILRTPAAYTALAGIMDNVYGITDPGLQVELALAAAGVQTTSQRIRMLRDWSFPLDQIIQHTKGEMEAVDYYVLLLSIMMNGVTDDDKTSAVADAFGMDVNALLESWLVREAQNGMDVRLTAYYLKGLGNYGLTDLARLLDDMGYPRNAVISATLDQFGGPAFHSNEATILIEVYGFTDLDILRYFMAKGLSGRAIKPVLQSVYPSLTLYEIAKMYLDSGADGDSLFELLAAYPEDVDATLYKNLKKELRLAPEIAWQLLGIWGESDEDVIRLMDVAGYKPHEVFFAAHEYGGGLSVSMTAKYYAHIANEEEGESYTEWDLEELEEFWGEIGSYKGLLSPRQIAYYIALYDKKPRVAGRIAGHLRYAGYDFPTITKALVPARIAYDDDQAPKGSYSGAPPLELACTLASVRSYYNDISVHRAILEAKKNYGKLEEKYMLNVYQLLLMSNLCNGLSMFDIWDVVHDIEGTPTWQEAADYYDTDDSDVLALHVMKRFGADEEAVAAFLRKKGFGLFEAYNLMWIEVGYDFWDTHVSVVRYNKDRIITMMVSSKIPKWGNWAKEPLFAGVDRISEETWLKAYKNDFLVYDLFVPGWDVEWMFQH
jgi:hypothetical protein